MPGAEFFSPLRFLLPESGRLSIEFLRDVGEADFPRVKFRAGLVELRTLDFQRFLSSSQLREPSRVLFGLPPHGPFLLPEGLFPRLELDFSGKDCLILLRLRCIEGLPVLGHAELILTQGLGLGV